MVPKAFPYPLGIGIDVCDVRRVATLLRNQSLCNRWARKVFTRLEWPALWDQFQKVQRATTDNAGTFGWEDLVANPENHSSLLMLPEIPENWLNTTRTTRDELAQSRDVFYEQSPVRSLIRHLAGRWAAKEAVIKAHTNRRLYMHDISIIRPDLYPSMFSDTLKTKSGPIALIDPQMKAVLIDERVAETRVLRGFGPYSYGFRRGAMLTRQEIDVAPSNAHEEEAVTGAELYAGGEKYYERRAKIGESERQTAEVSISHDGDVAVAVCLALDQSASEGETDSVIDDGQSIPIHEPRWGDHGWISDEIIFRSVPEHGEPAS